jgi:outer membrane protein TolC
MRPGWIVLCLAAALGLSAGLAVAEPDGEVPGPTTRPPSPLHARHTYTLRECIAFAQANYPKIHEAAAQLERMRAQLSEARTAPYSGFTASAGVVLAPTLEGTAVYSPNSDATITSSMALAWRVGIEGAVPLWTFGKITSAVEAAKAQTKVGEQNVRKVKNEVELQVRQAYWGVQLSRDAQALLNDALGRVDKYLPDLEKKVESGEGDDIQLLKLKIHRAELEARRSEAEKQERVALASLRFLTGMGPALDVPDQPLRKVHHTVGPLAQYLTAARLFRPEINMARAGVVARRALVDLERARFYPDIAVALSASRSYAPEIANQVNPFVYDQANYVRYGIGLVLNWKLDFLPQAARIAQAKAQLEEIRATERYALGGVGVEVESAFADTEDAARRLDAYTEATRYAKQWLVKVQEGIDVGTFNDEDIVDPAKEYALKRFLQMNATLDYNMALAKLKLATGWDAIAPDE